MAPKFPYKPESRLDKARKIQKIYGIEYVSDIDIYIHCGMDHAMKIILDNLPLKQVFDMSKEPVLWKDYIENSEYFKRGQNQ